MTGANKLLMLIPPPIHSLYNYILFHCACSGNIESPFLEGLTTFVCKTLAQACIVHYSTRTSVITSFPGIVEPLAAPFPMDIIFARGTLIAELRAGHSPPTIH